MAATCIHCDHTVVRSHHEGLLGPVRIVSYCDRCGLVHDGDPALTEGLQAPSSATLSLAVEVRNPYPTPCMAYAIALVQAPRVAKSVESPVVRVMLPPATEGAATVRLSLDTPFTIPATHVLGACVVVGTSFVFPSQPRPAAPRRGRWRPVRARALHPPMTVGVDNGP